MKFEKPTIEALGKLAGAVIAGAIFAEFLDVFKESSNKTPEQKCFDQWADRYFNSDLFKKTDIDVRDMYLDYVSLHQAFAKETFYNKNVFRREVKYYLKRKQVQFTDKLVIENDLKDVQTRTHIFTFQTPPKKSRMGEKRQHIVHWPPKKSRMAAKRQHIVHCLPIAEPITITKCLMYELVAFLKEYNSREIHISKRTFLKCLRDQHPNFISIPDELIFALVSDNTGFRLTEKGDFLWITKRSSDPKDIINFTL